MFVNAGMEETYRTQNAGMDVPLFQKKKKKFHMLNSNAPVVTENPLLVHHECGGEIQLIQ